MSKDVKEKHPFVDTIGPGPYAYVGFYDLGEALAHQQSFGDTEQAFKFAPKLEAGLGTCAHCGRAITNVCIIRRGDGKLYGVGSDCIFKVDNRSDFTGYTKLERELKESRKIKNKARIARNIAALEDDYNEALIKLENQPHPNEYFASQGKTMSDYYKFCSKNVKNMKAAIARSLLI